MLATCSLSYISFPFSLKRIFSADFTLLEKRGFTVAQNRCLNLVLSITALINSLVINLEWLARRYLFFTFKRSEFI